MGAVCAPCLSLIRTYIFVSDRNATSDTQEPEVVKPIPDPLPRTLLLEANAGLQSYRET